VGQATPPLLVSVMTLLLLYLLPEPQVNVQLPQAFQPETLQSTGQALVLQEVDAERAGQAAPLARVCWVMLRV
jgi:hypothetical protein